MRLPQYKTWYGGKMHRWGIFKTKEGVEFIPPIDLRAPQLENTHVKDKNGKEIYTGHILKYAQYPFGRVIYEVGAVENSNGLLTIDGHSLSGKKIKNHLCSIDENGVGCLGLNNTKDVEIIGNIYENPNLLT